MQPFLRLSGRIRTGLLSLFLLPSLVACGSTLPLAPPRDLLQDCPVSDYPVLTNADLARLARDRADDLARCNADKEALREWAGKAPHSPVAPL